jgi:hypothetical protein
VDVGLYWWNGKLHIQDIEQPILALEMAEHSPHPSFFRDGLVRMSCIGYAQSWYGSSGYHKHIGGALPGQSEGV